MIRSVNCEESKFGQKKNIGIPLAAKEHSFKKIGVDIGDQNLRGTLNYADGMRFSGWSRK